MQEYVLSYELHRTTVTIDGEKITLQKGTQTRTFLIEQLKKMYIKDYKDYCALIIQLETSSGKDENINIAFRKNQASALELANALAKIKPTIDLRNVGKKQAKKELGIKEKGHILYLIIPLFVVLLSIFIYLPSIIHFLDGGSANVDIKQLIEKEKFGTRNLTVKACMLADGMVETTQIKRHSITTSNETDYFCLLTSCDYVESDTVYVMMKYSEPFAVQPTDKSFHVTLRNVMWEGPSKKEIEFFKNNYGVKLSEDLILLELKKDGIHGFGFLIIIVIVTIVAGFVIAFNYNANKRLF